MTRIRDITTIADASAIKEHLRTLAGQLHGVASRIEGQAKRDDRSVAARNFLSYAKIQVEQLGDFYPSNAIGLAWVTRNLFEVNLIVRYVLVSDSNFRLWLGQALNDERDFIDGILAVSSEQAGTSAYKILETERERLRGLGARYGLEPAKPFVVKRLAEELNLSEEYQSMYKLFSKYVHPSSVLINKWSSSQPTREWLNVFLIKAQLYASDTLQRIATAYGVSV